MKRIILFIIYGVFVRIFLKVILGIVYVNREAISKKKQFILVANHNSHLDTIAILSVLPYGIIEKVHPVAAADYFGASRVRSFFSTYFINALLIPRSRSGNEGQPDPIEMMYQKLMDEPSQLSHMEELIK